MAQQIKEIDSGREFDWGKTSKDYAKYRDIYPEEYYKAIVDFATKQNRQTYECLVMLSQVVKPKLLGLFIGICVVGIIIAG